MSLARYLVVVGITLCIVGPVLAQSEPPPTAPAPKPTGDPARHPLRLYLGTPGLGLSADLIPTDRERNRPIFSVQCDWFLFGSTIGIGLRSARPTYLGFTAGRDNGNVGNGRRLRLFVGHQTRGSFFFEGGVTLGKYQENSLPDETYPHLALGIRL